MELQQRLPFTVLKLKDIVFKNFTKEYVATALTVYGIETFFIMLESATWSIIFVATALTVYGIETHSINQIRKILLLLRCNSTYRLRY